MGGAAVELVELADIPDTFVSGLGRIEVLGPNCRFLLFVERTGLDGNLEKVVVARIVAPFDAIPDAVRQMLTVTGKKTADMAVSPLELH